MKILQYRTKILPLKNDDFGATRRGRVPAKESDRAIKAKKQGHREGDHLQGWACAFSAQGDMLAVTTAGVVDDEERKHDDQGGSVIVYVLDAV